MSGPQRRRSAPAGLPDPPSGSRAPWRKWCRCWHGAEPAEALPPRDREDLIFHLHRAGWSDVDIAAHTRLSTYTTGRIRDRLGLEPNQP